MEMDNWTGFWDAYNRGFSVIPIKANSKTPLIKWKEYQTRKTTEAEIQLWQKEFPTASPCLVCGAISNVIVLDIDGTDAHKLIMDRFGYQKPTVVVETPGGEDRNHAWYRYPKEFGFVQSFTSGYNKDLPHVDLKADLGYVLYPGALHKSGGRYQFVEGLSPRDVEIAEVPDWLLFEIQQHNLKLYLKAEQFAVQSAKANNSARRKPGYTSRIESYGNATLRNQIAKLSDAISGGRNIQLFISAASLSPFIREGVFTYYQVESELIKAATICGLIADDGISSVKATIASGFNSGAGEDIPLSDNYEPNKNSKVFYTPPDPNRMDSILRIKAMEGVS